MPRLAYLSVVTLILGAAAGFGASNVCDHAARQAARTTGVPLQVLRAIARIETGHTRNGQFQPWPWAVNLQGQGQWFRDRTAARDYIRHARAIGVQNLDVGCFQLNYRWHGQAFDSAEAMLDPRASALYAARFLAKLYRETGDWTLAAGAYHSRTEAHSRRYRARFKEYLTHLDGPVPAVPRHRPSAARPPALGSLFRAGARPPVINTGG